MSDCIKRDDAMKIICGNCMSPCALVEKANNPCATIKELVYLPSADVAPVRHGRWVVIDAEEPRRYGCSECKRLSWHMENYCPDCGARMDGEIL